MREGIQKYFAQEKGIGILAVFFWFVSLYLLGSSTPLGVGLAARTGARGFLQKPNWYLYPVFFPIVMWLSYSIWRDYVLAWKDFKEGGVLHSDEFRLVDRDDFGRILRLFARIRPLLFGLACIFGIVFTTIDSHSAFHLLSPAADLELAKPCTDRDFFIAARIPDYFPSASWTSSIWFSTWSYLMQGALIALGFLCLFQILFHGLFFTFFEGFDVVKKSRVAILLRVDDPNEEFGLSTWNDAINKGYIFLAAGMGIALVSHFSQPFNGPGLQACSPSSGQRLLGTILWTILVAPTLLPVLARFARLGKIRQIVNATNDESVRAARDKQRLWPWDKWDIGKLFALISLIEWLLIANIIDVRRMIDLVLKHFG